MIRILLDECLPVKLKYRFREVNADFTVSTVIDESWSGLKNGELLSKAQKQFDVFITNDQHLPHQQNIESFDIAIVILKMGSNRYADLVELVESAGRQIRSVNPGKVYTIDS